MIFTTPLKAKDYATLSFCNITFYESDDFYNSVESKRLRYACLFATSLFTKAMIFTTPLKAKDYATLVFLQHRFLRKRCWLKKGEVFGTFMNDNSIHFSPCSMYTFFEIMIKPSCNVFGSRIDFFKLF